MKKICLRVCAWASIIVDSINRIGAPVFIILGFHSKKERQETVFDLRNCDQPAGGQDPRYQRIYEPYTIMISEVALD